MLCKFPTSRHFLITQRTIKKWGRLYSVRTEKNGDGAVILHSDAPRIVRDLLTPSRISLLDLTLEPYLPPSLQQIRYSETELPPAYHFLFFPTSTSELDTLPDGYERHFAPKHPYKRRLWTQGRLEFRNPCIQVGDWADCVENIERVRHNEDSTDVWIERQIRQVPAGTESWPDWSVRELRCLRYLRNIPEGKDDEKTRLFDLATDFTHRFTPSGLLLTRYSYLTHNFHRIHIDPEYAQNTEKYTDVLVHGSLSVTFILTILTRFCISRNEHFHIKSAKYAMYRPLYVNNPITLTITTTNTGKKAILWNHKNQKSVECIIS